MKIRENLEMIPIFSSQGNVRDLRKTASNQGKVMEFDEPKKQTVFTIYGGMSVIFIRYFVK